ncbi:MAG: PQQ-like beta-propeller repeat protein, partial [Acidimicrobiia bacterium]|nr:PQQ-like beta-propeller repeat protein [Acidimicrobiia bacterium]
LTPEEVAEVLSTNPDEPPGLDPDLRAYLLRLDDIEPPELWPRILDRCRSRPPASDGLSTAATILLLAGVVAGVLWLARPGSDESIAQPIPQTSTTSPLAGTDSSPEVGVEPARTGRAQAPLDATNGEDGAVIHDVRLPSGERFRVSLPASLALELESVTFDRPPAPIVLSGLPPTVVRIEFKYCKGEAGMTFNQRGSVVGRTGETSVVICRPDEFLVTTVSTRFALSDEELEFLDVRPIEFGDRYPRRIVEALTVGDCPSCFRYGPIRHGSVVINQAGPDAVVAVRHDDLTTVWTFRSEIEITLLDPGPPDTNHDRGEGVWLSEVGGNLLNLDPETGELRWAVELDPGEADVGLEGNEQEPWLVWSSFPADGDNRAPVLRRIDPATGQMRWQAEGREGADWAWLPLATTDDLAVMVDVFADPLSSAPGRGSVVYAYDLETGRLMYSVDLDAPEGARTSRRLLQITEIDGSPALLAMTTHGVLARIDLDRGELLWATRVNPGVLRGVVELPDGVWALSIQSSPLGPYYLDAATGQRLVGSP